MDNKDEGSTEFNRGFIRGLFEACGILESIESDILNKKQEEQNSNG